jgi:hypothetical protein
MANRYRSIPALLMAAALGCALAWARQPAQAQAPACPVPLDQVSQGVAVCVDRGEGSVYRQGEAIEVCVSANIPQILIFPPPPPPIIRVSNSTDGGPESVIFEQAFASGQECFTGVIEAPTGQEVVKAEAVSRDGRAFASSTVTFTSIP